MTGQVIRPASLPRVEIIPPEAGDGMWSASCQRAGVEVFVHVDPTKGVAIAAVAVDIDERGKGNVSCGADEAKRAIYNVAAEWGFVQTTWSRRARRELPDRAGVQELLEFVLNELELGRDRVAAGGRL